MGFESNDPPLVDDIVKTLREYYSGIECCLDAAAEIERLWAEVAKYQGAIIDTEKLLCEILGREWSASGISIVSLCDDIKAGIERLRVQIKADDEQAEKQAQFIITLLDERDREKARAEKAESMLTKWLEFHCYEYRPEDHRALLDALINETSEALAQKEPKE